MTDTSYDRSVIGFQKLTNSITKTKLTTKVTAALFPPTSQGTMHPLSGDKIYYQESKENLEHADEESNMIGTGLRIGFKVAGVVAGAVWSFARSENALAMIKVAATFAAFIHSVEELRKANRQIGFRR